MKEFSNEEFPTGYTFLAQYLKQAAISTSVLRWNLRAKQVQMNSSSYNIKWKAHLTKVTL